jgi:hypothetical protein
MLEFSYVYIDDVSLTDVTSIREHEQLESSFSVSPIPANDLLHLEKRIPIQDLTITVYDITGRPVKSSIPFNETVLDLDLGYLSPGQYFISDGENHTIRFVIVR